ncbi:hypothetical protein J6590_063937 [Homalodisca vitripennis]|nr:hypothetical protein J6590_063937 [Homalodisca vitripennis]
MAIVQNNACLLHSPSIFKNKLKTKNVNDHDLAYSTTVEDNINSCLALTKRQLLEGQTNKQFVEPPSRILNLCSVYSGADRTTISGGTETAVATWKVAETTKQLYYRQTNDVGSSEEDKGAARVLKDMPGVSRAHLRGILTLILSRRIFIVRLSRIWAFLFLFRHRDCLSRVSLAFVPLSRFVIYVYF